MHIWGASPTPPTPASSALALRHAFWKATFVISSLGSGWRGGGCHCGRFDSANEGNCVPGYAGGPSV